MKKYRWILLALAALCLIAAFYVYQMGRKDSAQAETIVTEKAEATEKSEEAEEKESSEVESTDELASEEENNSQGMEESLGDFEGLDIEEEGETEPIELEEGMESAGG